MCVTTGTAGMAKQQRSVLLPESVYEFAEAYETGTGIKFNRLALASMLRFWFADIDQPNTIWIGLAVNVDRGAMKIEDIPLTMAEAARSHWENLTKRKELRDIENVSLDRARIELEKAEKAVAEWRARIKAAGSARDAVMKKLSGELGGRWIIPD